jgi:hypothetical protein
MEREAIHRRRGYGVTDLSNASIAYILVRMPADAVAEALATDMGCAMERNVLGIANPNPRASSGTVVWQLAGHSWSGFAHSFRHYEQRAIALSGSLNCDVLTFGNEDVSGWSSIQFLQRGLEVEQLQWGLDYSEEMDQDGGEELKSVLTGIYAGWDVQVKVVVDAAMQMTDQYLFRSRHRTIAEDELRHPERFINELFSRHDAYLPDLDEMPWITYPHHVIRSATLPDAAFANVHWVGNK